MALNYLSYATLPLPNIGQDFLLAQGDKSIFRYMSLSAGESLALKGTKSRSYLFVFLGQVSVYRESDENELDHLVSGEILTVEDKTETFHVTADFDSLIYHVDAVGLEKLASWTVISKLMEGDPAAAGRLNILMNFSSLQTLPVDSAFELSQRMKEVSVNKDDEVVKQNELADSFYIIMQGTAEVWQTGSNGEAVQVAKLTAGDSFGEDALLAESKRNATITMASDGKLLVCDKNDFQELVAHRSIEEITAPDAKTRMEDGEYDLIDVRYIEEHNDKFIEGSKLISLPDIRNSLGQFKKDQSYILYCSNGQRSAIGALILTRAGVNAVSLQGGIDEWPYETSSNTDT